MKDARACPARRPGFTLVEVILATTVMVVLAGSLTAAMHAGFSARSRAEELLSPRDAVSPGLDTLSEDLQCAPPPRGILAGAFVGVDGRDGASGEDADSVGFFTRPPASAVAAPGIVHVEYALRPATGEEPSALVRYVTVNLLAPQAEEPVEEVLCTNAVSVNFRYFDGTAWFDSWDSTTSGDTLPVAVEAIVGVPQGDTASRGTESTVQRFTRVVVLPCGEKAQSQVAAAGGRR